MSQTEQILDRFVESQGWSDNTVLDLCLTYIENQASPEAWEDYLTSLAEVDDDIDPDSPYGPNPDLVQSEVTVRFTGQGWVNDYAIDIDPEGDTDWNVSDATADAIQPALDRGSDLDFVKGDRFAPEWVREWQGPFEINVICTRHGGEWGDDETCPRCTFEDGNIRPTAEPGPLGPGAES
jgi:hypothetical protein